MLVHPCSWGRILADRLQLNWGVRQHTCPGIIMAMRIVRYFLTVGTAVLAWPSTAQACSCGGTSSSLAAVKGADLIFVGTVAKAERPSPRGKTNPDGSVGVGGPGPL